MNTGRPHIINLLLSYDSPHQYVFGCIAGTPLLAPAFPQCRHKYPQRSYIVIPTAAPDILCDKGMGQYLANILGQQAQQLILNGRQVQFVLSQISASPGIIHFQFRFLYKGIIINHNKTEPAYTKTSLFSRKRRRFFHGPVLERSGADLILKRKGEFF